MQYFDPDAGGDLKATFDEAVLDWADVSATTMFGCPSYRADGELFAVLVTDGIALTRLPDERRTELDSKFETGPFQAGDRTVTKWVQVPVADPSALESLLPFVEASYEAALDEAGK